MPLIPWGGLELPSIELLPSQHSRLPPHHADARCRYINSLVDVLNKNAADLHEEVDRLEGVVAGLKAQLAEIPGQVSSRFGR
jgi:hypothetical protein